MEIIMPSKSALEVVAEIEREDCHVTNALVGVNCSIMRLIMRPDFTLHRVKATADCDPIEFARLQGFKLRRVNSGTYWVESSSCSVCELFSKMSFVKPIGTNSIGRSRLQVRVIVASKADFRLFKNELERAHLRYTIISVTPYLHQELTKKEEEALEEALRRGYFEIDGRLSLTDLSRVMGITPASLSELLRRGLKKTVTNYLYQA